MISAMIKLRSGEIVLRQASDWEELFNSLDIDDWEMLSASREDE